MVFNILVFDPITNVESVYSPVVTYGCSFTAKVDGCDSLGMFHFTINVHNYRFHRKCASLCFVDMPLASAYFYGL